MLRYKTSVFSLLPGETHRAQAKDTPLAVFFKTLVINACCYNILGRMADTN
ncbi:hypothetical protein [Desulfogranum marinum]|uniref:hypothetical protein n=1 Tax=Desulfogranum marinum TaxID=453220 RepID=UPI0029C88EFF|nr:hypothetical protein [Desulfogranum marinum]